MKKLKVLISAILIFSIVLSFSNVFATTTSSSLGEGYYGYMLDNGTTSSVSDGTLTVTQNADKIYDYVDTNNMLINAGFEDSDTVVNSKNSSEMTTGWIDNQSNDSTKLSVSLSKSEVHSGANSLYMLLNTTDAGPRLYNNAQNSTDCYFIVDKDQKYTFSYWAKGNASIRVIYQTWDSSQSKWSASTWPIKAADYKAPGDDWQLITHEFSVDKGNAKLYSGADSEDESDDVYVARMAVHTCITKDGSAGEYAYLDDVQLQTTEQAIKNVVSMIENLDITLSTAERAIDDIEQWITALGSENISNYDLFQMKKSGYVYYNNSTYLENTGFEKSDVVTAINGDGNNKELTTGWTTNYGNKNVVFGISTDSHSGYNALSVNVTSGNDGRLHSSKNYIYTSNVEGDEGYNKSDVDFRTGDLKTNTEYILSYWVKGTGQTHIWGRTVNSDGTTNKEYRGTYITNPGVNWTLGTNRLTTNENGEFWWNIFVNNPAADGVDTVTAIIDDIQVLTVEENIAFVDSLIDQLATFDNSSDEYVRAKADIEAWLSVLDSADLNLKYDTVLNQKYNIITPNTGYTGLAQGYYVASVSLKGEGSVNRVYGTDILDIEKISTALTSDFVTYNKPVTVGADGTYYIGVQLTETDNVNVTEIKGFSLDKLENGDVNFDKSVNIRDIVRLRAKIDNESVEICEGTANANNDSALDIYDIDAIRSILLQITE